MLNVFLFLFLLDLWQNYLEHTVGYVGLNLIGIYVVWKSITLTIAGVRELAAQIVLLLVLVLLLILVLDREGKIC